MKKETRQPKNKSREKELVVNYIIKSEQEKGQALKDFVRSQMGSSSSGKKIVLNCK